VANHLRHHGGGGNDSRGRRRNNNNIVPCAICKGNTTGFVPVFIELGCGGAAGSGSQVVVGDGADSGVIDVDNDKEDKVNQDEEDAVEKLYDEWDGLWKELETLCGYTDQQHETTTSASSSVLERRGDREIAQICIAIDLTQPSPPPKSGTSQRGTLHHAEEGKQREVHDQIKHILNRLKAIQHDIRNKQSHRKVGGTNQHHQQQHLERLRAKISKLQSDNSELHRESSKLQESNNSLSAKLAESEKISSDFIVEMERSKLKYESLQKQHQQSHIENARLMAQYTNEKSTLTNTILKLRQQNTELMEDVSLENIKELEEVRTRYTKMTQAVHDAKLERNKTVLELTRKVQELEGRYKRETSEHDLLKCRMKEEQFAAIDRAERRCPTTNDDLAASMRKVAPSKHPMNVSSFGEESARSDAMIQQSSSSRTTSGNRALDVLNKTSSRKFPMHLDQPPPRRRHNPHHHHQNAVLHHRSTSSSLSSSPNEETDEVEPALNNGVQLLMRTGDIRHRSSKKKRRSEDTRSGRLDEGKENNESSNSSSGHTTMKSLRTDFLAERGGVATADSTATRRRATVVVVALNSPPSKRRGGIKSYFKPCNLK
jgi:hypothetical protein